MLKALNICWEMLWFSPVQINEEAEQVVTQFNHGLLHVGLELTSVVDLSGVKHTHVSHWNLHVPVGSCTNRDKKE